MAVLVKSIRSDPRWVDLVVRYRYNWVVASIVLFGFHPMPDQVDLLNATEKDSARVTVSSGHGTGKSSQIAVVVLMYMLFYPDARVVLVANKLDQVKIGVWKNVRKYFKVLLSRQPWLADYYSLTEESFFEISGKGEYMTSWKSCRPGNEEALSGEHADHLLWIIDEASGISDKAFDFILGSTTGLDNRVVLLSQPTRDNGFFWRTHNDPEVMIDWVQLIFNSELSPLVTEKFILEQFRKFGSNRDAPEYMIKVRGEFPKNLSYYLLSSDDMVQAGRARPRLGADWGWVLTCDVGNGRDSSIINITRVSGQDKDRRVVGHEVMEFEGTIKPINLGRQIINLVRSGDYHNISVAIDNDGIGSSTADIVEEAGIPVQRINWGLPTFSVQDKKLYQDQRAKCHIAMRDAVREGRIRVDRNKKTVLQGSKIPAGIDHLGRYVIEKKKVMKEKLNIPSPDRWDTYCMIYLVDYTPATALVDVNTLTEREEAGSWAADVTKVR